MGQANCCHQKADKDLFVDAYLQKDKFKEVEGNEVDQAVAPVLDTFRNDHGNYFFMKVLGVLRRSMVHKNGGNIQIRINTSSATGKMQK